MSDRFWIFGYGSLMWRPGFEYLEAMPARMPGVHRAPCIYSWVHRGTQEAPGIVLGLDSGGSCRGMGFSVCHTMRDETMAYLRSRELTTKVYLETVRPMVLESGEQVDAVAYIVDRKHQQYAGRVAVEDLVSRIARSVGQSGPNDEYFIETTKKLRDLGIRDHLMEQIVEGLDSHAS